MWEDLGYQFAGTRRYFDKMGAFYRHHDGICHGRGGPCYRVGTELPATEPPRSGQRLRHRPDLLRRHVCPPRTRTDHNELQALPVVPERCHRRVRQHPVVSRQSVAGRAVCGTRASQQPARVLHCSKQSYRRFGTRVILRQVCCRQSASINNRRASWVDPDNTGLHQQHSVSDVSCYRQRAAAAGSQGFRSTEQPPH